MWVFTVAVETWSLRAISWLVRPSAISTSTSVSRAVSPSGASVPCAGTAGSGSDSRSSKRR